MLQPAIYNPYARLMRLHQPVGIWLLFWPCAWSLMLASNGKPSLKMVGLFFFGAIVMRSVGCVINDIWDRDIDKQVERTRLRPLASAELSLQQALLLLTALLLIAFFILLQLPVAVWYLAFASLIPVAIYPAMKRITWWPQLFLGMAFNWGALMGWVAVTGTIEPAAIALYISGVFWTLGYDTIYAHQDKVYDAKIGVKSSALRLGKKSALVVTVFYLICTALMVLAGLFSSQPLSYYLGVMFYLLQLLFQLATVDLDNPTSCLKQFKSNAWAGLFPISGLFLGTFF
jgi:4-hydroxybenzoate polyprenyltransferase